MREFKLYNRYKTDVRLVEVEENVFKLELPKYEWDWVQYSYDENDVYHSIDPSGGPYIALNDNVLSIYPEGVLRLAVDKIWHDEKMDAWLIMCSSVVANI
jgi:hypothetical protein